MKMLQNLIVSVMLLCVNLFAQADINSSGINSFQSIKDGIIQYENGPDGINAVTYLAPESFETFLPTGWLNWTPTAGSWQQTSPQSYTGTNSAFADAVPNSESWLVTPAINLTGAIDPVLIFYNYFDDTFSNEYNDERIIKISTDYTNNGDPSTATWNEVPFDVYDFQIWYRKQILLSDYSNQIIYIAFVYKGNGSGSILHGVDWYLDDVSVEEKTIEDFEDEFNFPPNGWSSNGFGWEQAFNGYNSNLSAYAYFDPFQGPSIDRWLITPQINLTSATTPGLKYYELVYPAEGGIVGHDVLISTNGGGSWSILRSIIGIQDWNLIEIDLTSYIGNNIQIAFNYYFDSQGEEIFGSEWYIDDVSITNDGGCTGTEPIPDCVISHSPPDGATLYHNYVSLFWSPPQFDATTQTLTVWTEVNGNPVVFYEDVFETNVSGVGPFTSPLFENNTTYYWQVVPANCSQVAVNCPIWSFTTNNGEYNYGGGTPSQGGYYFANSTAGASGAPSQPTYDWVDISVTGTDIIGSIANNETIGPFPLGFSFNYFGTSFTEFYINSNGFITFSPPTAAFTNFPQQIPFTSSYDQDNIVAGYWKDFDPTNINVSDKHLYYGSNNGDMVITFENYPEFLGDANAWLTFQIILKQNGNIKFQYQNRGSSFVIGGECVGIENSDGSQGITYRYRGAGAQIFKAGPDPTLALEFGTNSSALPVELSSFSATVIGKGVKLKWATETEVNNYGFEVERRALSAERQAWENIGFVNGSGNSNSPKEYSFNDKNTIGGKYSYRLKQIDNDGKFEYSNIIEVDIELPLEYSLDQNYPNPFNPSTKIKYSIPNVTLSGVEGSRVQLKIYDVLGNEVATLVDENKSAGSYEIDFNAAGLTSGVYFYKLQAGNFLQTKKMILIK